MGNKKARLTCDKSKEKPLNRNLCRAVKGLIVIYKLIIHTPNLLEEISTFWTMIGS